MLEFNDILIEHFENPRNIGKLDECDVIIQIGNEVCGDKVDLYIKKSLVSNKVAAIAFKAYGCSTAIAITSILTEIILTKTIEEITLIEEKDIVKMVGGLVPSQMHCAILGKKLLHKVVQAFACGDTA